jgi:hypothetical protein
MANMTSLRAAALVSSLFFILPGAKPAHAICIAGFGNSLECRYTAACTKKGASSNSCACSFNLAQQGFPPEQLGTFVDVFEAYADNDAQRRNLIQSRLGFAAIEFTARLNSVMNAASSRCGP